MTCKYLTVLNRDRGRPATRRLCWTETRSGVTGTFDEPYCTFHHDLTVAELVLDCTIDAIITNSGVAA